MTQIYPHTKLACVYRISNPMGSNYVGSTMNVTRRRNCYKNNSAKSQIKIYESILKYGWKNHLFEIIWIGNANLRYEKERKFGEELRSMSIHGGLNLVLPGYGDVASYKSKETIDRFLKSMHWKPLSEDTKRKMVLNNKRQKPSQLTKTKSILATGRTVYQYDLNNKFISEYSTVSEAARKTKIGRTNIKNNLTKLSKTAGGFIWKYKEGKSNGRAHKKVVQISLNGEKLREFESMKSAANHVGICATSIRYVVYRGGKTAAVYKWELV